MIQKGNFLLLEKSEFRDWLKKQIVARPIKTLQVHHTALPNYTTRQLVNGVAKQDVFKCLEGMRNSHLSAGWAATGQNISIMEDGKVAISLDRNLNRIPAGIRGANNNSICIEIIGQFDKNCDTMTDVQKESVIHVYASLAERFKLPINTDTIVYHAWFTAKGVRLNDYTPGKSSKTCPGTAFFGDGNTITAAKKGFLPAVQKELNRLTNNIKEEDEPMTPSEKLEFEKLQQSVRDLKKELDTLTNSKDVLKKGIQEQGASIKNVKERVESLESKHAMNIPIYAKEAVEALTNLKDQCGNPVVNTPEGRSADFYSLVTVLYRAGVFK
ncbi:N-acetylmuramoyl-L-alanine amidase [Paenibacillus lautus]|uniref:N-acetylmuramoyl-L-alanine amidase n=1 Tax=Paenibacillus lautus TaxID=1401 RepID=UPI001C7CC5E3|nr:N-acetylmuramoyl-L-alanine amidase [Paenibacillus lautus]MBX4147492.1 N-acetylmuramoyl-L-alanine amidase [Paenibacillus lautus]